MAHIRQVPSLLKLAYGNRTMDIDEGATWVREKLERSWKKLDTRVEPVVTEEFNAAMDTLSMNQRVND